MKENNLSCKILCDRLSSEITKKFESLLAAVTSILLLLYMNVYNLKIVTPNSDSFFVLTKMSLFG